MGIQRSFPVYPANAKYINKTLAYTEEGDYKVYYNGSGKNFFHKNSDDAAFMLIICQLCILKNASIKEISIALDINKETLKSWIKKFCKSKSKAFYNPPKNKSATVMTCEKLYEIQDLLNSGLLISKVSHNTGIKSCNIYKAIKDGKIKKFKKNNYSKGNIDNKSERTRRNLSQPMGNFCLRTQNKISEACKKFIALFLVRS